MNFAMQGAFSHSLAEYAMTSCLYFAKCIQELQANQKAGAWKKLYVEELRQALNASPLIFLDLQQPSS